MKRLITIALTVLAAFASATFPNDGVFYAQGNTLVPLQETQVRLKKEILKFFIRDFRFADVDVDFEFYNPGGDRTLTVGFVSPPAMGDVEEDEGGHPRITNFTVNVNGKDLEYKIAQMEKTSFNAEALDVNGFDYVYYFTMTFKPGLNRVRHTYRFEGGASVETQRDFYYQITTGKRWANKQIDDFELQLHLDQGIFNLPARFVKGKALANWQIVGDGVLKGGAEKFYDFDEDTIRMVHLNRGHLVFKAKDFKPDFDISISEFNWAAGWLRKMCSDSAPCVTDEEVERLGPFLSIHPGEWIGPDELKQLTNAERRILRNFGFAVRGYDLKDKTLKRFYKRFFWYKPDPSVKAEDVDLSEAEKEFIKKIETADAHSAV
ncbi:MAG: YARHG domain-containing protein [Acidobacteriota bacterium]|nr:MAG: YARHG domain-containing protein [Acidobacteriota bacterium]